MARIGGVEIPNEKRIEIALTYLYGIGKSRSRKTLNDLEIDINIKVKDLTDDQTNLITRYISDSDYLIEGELRAEIRSNIKRLEQNGSYRGIRHRKGLPLRGQRTKNNSRTRKGKKKTVAGKKQATK